MKILESMLKKWVEIPKDIYELTNQKIIEIDEFGPVNPATKLVVGHVLTCVDHPNSDHLHVTTVDLGDRIEQIVCGAPNVAQGQYVIVAQNGTVLPGNFEIKATKIRGVESNGMICSLKELGIDDKNAPEDFRSGIYHFDGAREIGSSGLAAIFQDGWVMTPKLTPNRGDLLSVLGFAYDLASMTGQKVHLPHLHIKEEHLHNPYDVDIQTDGCGRYYARHFTYVKIKESPWWLKSALMACDIAPINNVVDISNYVLLEYGTPLHMFDAKKIGSTKIVVRDAHPLEKVITLDDVTRTLSTEDLVITNGKDPIAIAGVMGLANTMITSDTTEVVLEAAYFEPKRIQKTSKKLGMRSDSSLRFERGIDDERVFLGLERASELLVELAGAKVSKGIASCIHHKLENPTIRIEKNYFNEALGVVIPELELIQIFNAYNYHVEYENDHILVKAPSYRKDILIEADVLEEVARMYGLDRIPMTSIDKPLPGKLTFKQKRLRQIRHHFANLGLNEVITYSLINPAEVHRYHNLGEPVSILMPLSEDRQTLRQSLVHGILESVLYNQYRQMKDIAIFEIGNVFALDQEKLHLSVALSGTWHQLQWKKERIAADFYVLKGLIDGVFHPLGLYFNYESSQEIASFHPYRQANIKYQNQTIGRLAELHPSEVKRLGIEPTVVFEIDMSLLLTQSEPLLFKPISRYPSISRDLAIVVSDTITAGQITDLISQTAKKNLVAIEVFDVYQGTHIEKGQKSIACSLQFNDPEKTLSSDDVDQLMKKITNRLSFSLKAVIRN
jgi:phenylalanyl-tRNA synthetase beta chain